MTPTATAAAATLAMAVLSATLHAYRRRRAVRLGDPYPQNVFPGLRWAASLRAGAAGLALILLMVITAADVTPLLNRLFPAIDDVGAAMVVAAFHEVLALAIVGAVSSGALADLTSTFVSSDGLRRALMMLFTLTLVGSGVYAGLFVYALLIS